MTTPAVAPVWNRQFFDATGKPLAGGKIYTYIAGSSTPQTVYKTKDLSGGASWTNPIVLDSAGWVPGQIFPPVSPAIKYIVTDANDVGVGYDADNIIANAGAS